MTSTVTKAVTATKAERPRSWYGVSAREFKALLLAEKNPARIAEMRAYASATAKRRAAKSPRFAAKWEAIATGIVTPSATFTAKPLPKAKASRKASAKAADPVAAALAASGLDASALLLMLAQRV